MQNQSSWTTTYKAADVAIDKCHKFCTGNNYLLYTIELVWYLFFNQRLVWQSEYLRELNSFTILTIKFLLLTSSMIPLLQLLFILPYIYSLKVSNSTKIC